MAIELASAYVSLVPSAKGLRREISEELGLVGRDAAAAGDGAGREFGNKFTKGLLAVGAGVGLTFGAALFKGTVDAINRESINDKLAAQLGLDPAEAQRVGEVSSALYADAWGDNMEEVSAAVRGVYSELDGANLDREELQGYTSDALALAGAFDQDVNEVLRATSAILSNDLAPGAGDAFDIIAAGFQAAGPRGDDLLETFSEYSNQFADFGINAEEAMAILVAGLDGGARSTDGVADATKELFLRLTEAPEPVRAALGELGLDYQALQDQINSGEGAAAFQAVLQQISDLESQTDKARLAQTLLGGTYEQVGLEGIESMALFQGALGDTAGASQELADTLSDNLGTRFEAIKRQGLQLLADFAVRTVIPALEKILPAAEAIVAVLGEDGLAGAARLIGERLGFLNNPIIIGALVTFGAIAVGVLVPAFIAWASAATAAAVATIAANAPLILIAAAIGAVVAVLVYAYRNSELFRNVVDSVAGFLKDRLLPAVRSVAGWLADNFVPALKLVGRFALSVLSVFGEVAAFLAGALASGIADSARGWFNLGKTMFEVGKRIIGVVFDIISAVVTLPTRVSRAVRGWADGFIAPFRSMLDALRRLWNRTVGGFGFDIPDWVPSIGGNSFRIPKLHDGGVVEGPSGAEGLFVLEAGETVLPADYTLDSSPLEASGSGQGIHIEKVEVVNRPWLEEFSESINLRPVPLPV